MTFTVIQRSINKAHFLEKKNVEKINRGCHLKLKIKRCDDMLKAIVEEMQLSNNLSLILKNFHKLLKMLLALHTTIHFQ